MADELPPDPLAGTALGAISSLGEAVGSGVSAYRAELISMGVAQDFRDQMCADFARFLMSTASLGTLRDIALMAPAVLAPPAGPAFLERVLATIAAGERRA